MKFYLQTEETNTGISTTIPQLELKLKLERGIDIKRIRTLQDMLNSGL
jgi:hypothetical protein